jgi:hypothetical protein
MDASRQWSISNEAEPVHPVERHLPQYVTGDGAPDFVYAGHFA